MPTRNSILLWLTFIMGLLSIVTTPPSFAYPSYFFQLVAAFLLSIVLLAS